MGAFWSAACVPPEPSIYDAATTEMLYVDQLALWEIHQDILARGITQKTADFYSFTTSARIEKHGSPLVALPFFVDESSLAEGGGRKVWLLLRRSEPPEDAGCVCRSAVVCDTPTYMNVAGEIARRGVTKHYVWVAGTVAQRE